MSTTPAIHDQDEQRLAELGYKQELNRSWSGFQNFAISFTIISILAGCFTTYGQAWNNGGPIAISWGWPLISIPILIIGFCMSELVSAYPTAGGIYWWASKLGGPGWGWFTGWFNLIGLDRRDRVGRLRLRDVHEHHARPRSTSTGSTASPATSCSGTFWLFLRGPRAPRGDQHRAAATSSRASTAISVWWHVARRRGDHRWS